MVFLFQVIEMKEYLKSIEVLPDEKENMEFWERENKKSHTSYETEILFFSCIMHGDTERLGSCLEKLMNDGIVAGKLSENSLRQMKYWQSGCHSHRVTLDPMTLRVTLSNELPFTCIS